MTKLSKEANEILLKDVCTTDESGVFEAIATLCIEHGMPFDNISAFLLDLNGVLARWKSVKNEK